MEDQIVKILQAVQEVTPEIASQAIVYGQWCNVCWIVFAIILGLAAALVARFCRTQLNNSTGMDCVLLAIAYGITLMICLLISVCNIGNLVGSYIAPDYYAVQAIIDMFKVSQ